jgi:hypothetical protein
MWIPLSTEVLPRRIYRFDQRNLLGAQPAFEFLFSVDRGAHLYKSFESDQAVAVIASRESATKFQFVFEDAAAQVTGDAYVESAASACDDVGEVRVPGHTTTIAEWETRGECYGSRCIAKGGYFASLKKAAPLSMTLSK